MRYEWDLERTGEVRNVTVVAIHSRDDVIDPSVVDVDLGGGTPLGVRTNQEERYQVGKQVELRYDVSRPNHSAFVGDSNGPDWTLPTLSVGFVGGIIFGGAGLLIFTADIIRRLRSPGPPNYYITSMLTALFEHHQPKMGAPPSPMAVARAAMTKRADAIRLLGACTVLPIALGVILLLGYAPSPWLVRAIVYLNGPVVLLAARRFIRHFFFVPGKCRWESALAVGTMRSISAVRSGYLTEALLATDVTHACVYHLAIGSNGMTTIPGNGPHNVWVAPYRRGVIVWLPDRTLAFTKPIGQWKQQARYYDFYPPIEASDEEYPDDDFYEDDFLDESGESLGPPG